MSPLTASDWIWAIWYVSWWMAAVWASKPASRPIAGGAWLHRVLALLGAILLFFHPPNALKATPAVAWLIRPLWSEPASAGWLLVAALIGCFGFCWWARVHLGRLWSGLVTTKAEHRIVDTGPYRLVRHPIYTGVIFAALVMAFIEATPAGFLGFAFLAAGFSMTAKVEEQFLRLQLGPEDYDAYSRRTPMIVPGLRLG